jgi:hypothetical protein
MSSEILQRHMWKMSLPRPELVSFGLEAHGHGTIVGCGNQAIGIARHIRVLSGFRTAMLFTMDAMYSFAVGGDDLNVAYTITSKGIVSKALWSFKILFMKAA